MKEIEMVYGVYLEYKDHEALVFDQYTSMEDAEQHAIDLITPYIDGDYVWEIERDIREYGDFSKFFTCDEEVADKVDAIISKHRGSAWAAYHEIENLIDGLGWE